MQRLTKLCIMAFVIAGITTFFFASSSYKSKKMYSEKLINKDGSPTKTFSALLEKLDLVVEPNLDAIVATTQATLLRKPGTERWQMEEKWEQKADVLRPLFIKLGCIDEIKPSQTTYDYALILGAILPTVRIRLAYTIALWNAGIRFKHLIFLSGARDLDPTLESEQELLNGPKSFPAQKNWSLTQDLPTTEAEMMQMVYDQAALPDSLKKIPLTIINAPKHANGARPTTGDTANSWLEKNPQPGSVLAISNQPFVGYQHAVLLTLLPKSFVVETVGDHAFDTTNLDVLADTKMGVLLDNLARWLYQEKQRRNKSN